jgi:hypothetical protein
LFFVIFVPFCDKKTEANEANEEVSRRSFAFDSEFGPSYLLASSEFELWQIQNRRALTYRQRIRWLSAAHQRCASN